MCYYCPGAVAQWHLDPFNDRPHYSCIQLSRFIIQSYEYIDYFMESARVRYLGKRCWRIRKRTRERSARVCFLLQKQRVCKYRTKHFPCCNLFMLYSLRFSTPTRFHPLFRRTNIKLCFYTVWVQTLGRFFCVMLTSLQLRLICFRCLAFF